MNKFICIFIFMLLVNRTEATGIPTVDIANAIIETRETMILVQELKAYYDEFVQMKAKYDAITGLSNFSSILSNVYGELNIDPSAFLASIGIDDGGAMGLTGDILVAYNNKNKTAATNLESMTQILDQVTSRDANLSSLIGFVRSASNVKKAIDSGSRVKAENVLLLNEEIRTIAIQAKAMAEAEIEERKDDQRRIERTKTDGAIDLSTL